MANAHAQDRRSPETVVRFSPKWSTILASPMLYVVSVPLLFVDLCLEVYHRLTFPLLGIPLVRRREYIRIDRHRLQYLPAILKLACVYCGYANGLLQYAARIAADTEAYFCPIKHQDSVGFHQPPHHRAFVEYDDEEGFWLRQEEEYRKQG